MQERGGKVGGRTLTERAWDRADDAAPIPGRRSLVQLSHSAIAPAVPAAQSEPAQQAHAVPQLPSYSSILRCFGGPVQRQAVQPSDAGFEDRSPQPEVATPDEAAGTVLHSPMASRVANEDSALDA